MHSSSGIAVYIIVTYYSTCPLQSTQKGYETSEDLLVIELYTLTDCFTLVCQKYEIYWRHSTQSKQTMCYLYFTNKYVLHFKDWKCTSTGMTIFHTSIVTLQKGVNDSDIYILGSKWSWLTL